MGRLISEKYAAWQAECEQRFQTRIGNNRSGKWQVNG